MDGGRRRAHPDKALDVDTVGTSEGDEHAGPDFIDGIGRELKVLARGERPACLRIRTHETERPMCTLERLRWAGSR